MKEDYVQPLVGHYGVFNGRRFREEIYPRVRDFIRKSDPNFNVGEVISEPILPVAERAMAATAALARRTAKGDLEDMNLFRPQRYADGDRLDVRGCAVRLKVDGRARRISLRVDRAKSEVVALAPTPRRLSEAVAFAHEKADWIAGQLAALPTRQVIAPGGVLRLLGKPYRLEVGPGRRR
jgi:hypothetical protein